jgi:membrane-bound acyltransferase YfiQ involved in biofilm formation
VGDEIMRKYYIDNLRWISVLLLFPFHILMIYNTFESFYIKGVDIKATTTLIWVIWPWFMPLLFAVAGINTAYAMKKRRIGEYVKDRISKLLVPLAAGILLVIPAQTYFAELFHNNYIGGYFNQYVLFFTKPTDLMGYTGGFTPSQLWFILFLFVISLAAIPLIIIGNKMKHKPDFSRTPMLIILCLFILPSLCSLILNIGNRSLCEYFVYFLLGYFLLSDDDVQQRLETRRAALIGVSLVCTTLMVLEWYKIIYLPGIAYGIFSRFYGWATIMALLGLSRKCFNMNNRFTAYMSRSSFSVYMFHLTWIVVSAYYVFMVTENIPIQMALILIFSVFATFATYEICRRFRVTRFLFSIKKQGK